MNLPWFLARRLQRPGRRPYTNAEIEQEQCFRCGDPASEQWQACANGNIWRPLCVECDVALNRLVLRWMGHPSAEELGDEYAAHILHPSRTE